MPLAFISKPPMKLDVYQKTTAFMYQAAYTLMQVKTSKTEVNKLSKDQWQCIESWTDLLKQYRFYMEEPLSHDFLYQFSKKSKDVRNTLDPERTLTQNTFFWLRIEEYVLLGAKELSRSKMHCPTDTKLHEWLLNTQGIPVALTQSLIYYSNELLNQEQSMITPEIAYLTVKLAQRSKEFLSYFSMYEPKLQTASPFSTNKNHYRPHGRSHSSNRTPSSSSSSFRTMKLFSDKEVYEWK